jgi:hypothetical protein
MASPTPALSAQPASGTNSILGVLFSPGPTMDDLIRHPRFLPALLLVTIIGMGMMALALQRGVIEQFMRHKMENNPRMEQIPAERRQQAIEMSVKFSSYMFVGGAAIGPTIGLLATSGFFLLMSNVILGAKAKFRQMLAVVSHAWVPHAIVGLLSIPILLAKEPDTIDMQNIVALSNLSFLFDSAQQPKFYAIASGFDLFSFWVIALLAVGLSRLTGKSKVAVLPVIVVPWLLWVLIVKPLQQG